MTRSPALTVLLVGVGVATLVAAGSMTYALGTIGLGLLLAVGAWWTR